MARQGMQLFHRLIIYWILWVIIDVHRQDILEDFQGKTRVLIKGLRRYINDEPDDPLLENWILSRH
jgi:hypothetical protein